MNMEQGTIGFTRLLFPFFAGLLISRLNWKITMKRGFWWCAPLLAAALVMPRIGGTSHGLWNGIYEAVCILLLFPILVAMGASSHVTGKSHKFCTFLGNLSYPLYITQYPIVYTFFGSWQKEHRDIPTAEIIFLNMMVFFFCIFMAYACLKLYDIPLRAWQKEHWLKKGTKKQTDN